jgi:hypothetical protein
MEFSRYSLVPPALEQELIEKHLEKLEKKAGKK